jgi:hypothetical protein
MKKQLTTLLFVLMLFNYAFAQMPSSLANIKDGEYMYQDSKLSYKVVIKGDNLEKLELNGILIPASDYPKYDELINNVMNKLQQHQKAMTQNEKDRRAHGHKNV